MTMHLGRCMEFKEPMHANRASPGMSVGLWLLPNQNALTTENGEIPHVEWDSSVHA